MLLIAALLGIALGSMLTVFTIQNTATASVAIFAWHLSAPLAFILAGAISIGVLAALVSFLPTISRAERRIKELKEKTEELETELAKYHITIPIAPPAADAAALLMARPKAEAVNLPL